jgi:hypothetical protein
MPPPPNFARMASACWSRMRGVVMSVLKLNGHCGQAVR